MGAPKRISGEEIIAAYKATGSVWKAAKLLGVVGQSVWERLRALGYKLPTRMWSADEVAELRGLASTCTITDIALRLGRPYAGVACKLSELGLTKRVGNRGHIRPLQRSAVTRDAAARYASLLPGMASSLRQFARMHGVTTTALVSGLQRHFPEAWARIASERGIEDRTCVNCGETFPALSKKQQCCSGRCTHRHRENHSYFGGRRAEAEGLAEKTCQVCARRIEVGLSAHHVVGKENDPDNDLLIALCRSCHKLVGMLGATPSITDRPEAWEALVMLARMRLHGAARPIGLRVSVEWDWLTKEDLEDMEAQMETLA